MNADWICNYIEELLLMLLEYNDGIVVMFLKREGLFFVGLFFRFLY